MAVTERIETGFYLRQGDERVFECIDTRLIPSRDGFARVLVLADVVRAPVEWDGSEPCTGIEYWPEKQAREVLELVRGRLRELPAGGWEMQGNGPLT